MTECTFTSDLTVELIDHMGSDYHVIDAMMVSTRGQREVEDYEGMIGRINFLMKNRHGTPFEHGALMFRVHAPIAVFREWHRHRIGFSYNEESGRYKKLDPVFYIPPVHRPLAQQGKPGHYEFVPGTTEQFESQAERIRSSCRFAYEQYERGLEDDIAKEVARGVLPVYIYSSMYVTCNPRSLMAFLSLRTRYPKSTYPSFPMWEIEQCGVKMEQHFSQLWPITWNAFRENGSVCP